jgi:putative ABC transport system substrate-binding protein
MTFFAAVLAGKRVELLKEIVPTISRVFVLANPGHAGEQLELKETEEAARTLAVTVYYQPARASGDFNNALDAITTQRANALITFPDALTLAHRKRIADFSFKSRLPSISGWSQSDRVIK